MAASEKTALMKQQYLSEIKTTPDSTEPTFYTYYPPNTINTHHDVQLIEFFNAQQTQQNAFDYYMTRISQFAHIAKIAAIDDVIFEIFVGMLANVRNIEGKIQSFLADVLPNLYEGMRLDTKHDHQVLWRITQVYESLTICRDNNNVQSIKHFFDEELERLNQMIQRVFDSKQTSIKSVVSKLLSKSTTFYRYTSDVVEQASVMYHPVIRTALDMEITSLFGVPQVSSFIEKLLSSNLMAAPIVERSKDPPTLSFSSHTNHLMSLIHNRHTQSFENIRYCPIVLFFLEGFSKLVLLALVSYVSVHEYGLFFDTISTSENIPIKTWTEFSMLELAIVVMTSALFLSEAGQWESNTMERYVKTAKLARKKTYLDGFIDNFFRDIWNFFDLFSLVLLIVWFGFKVSSDGAVVGKVLLAAAAIPESLGMLRYFSIQKAMGNLIITVVSMSRELFAFAIIYVMSIFGFGVTLKALFQTKEDYEGNWYQGFGSMTSTSLTLFDATLGQHDFGQMGQENTYIFYIGLLIEMVFLVFTLIILFNLLIAKMTSAYEEKQESALRDWEYARATILRQFILRGEASPLSMLPAPFNLITALFYLPHWFWINLRMQVPAPFNLTALFYLFHWLWMKVAAFFCLSHWLRINPRMHETWLHSNGLHEQEHFIRGPDQQCLSVAGTVADLVFCILSAPFMSVFEVMFDVLEMIDIGKNAFEEESKRLIKLDSKASSWINISSLVEMPLLFLSHVLFVILVSPFTYMYYVYQHFQAVATKRVYLQFESKTNDNLIIVYPCKPAPQEASRDFKKDFFQGLIVRSAIYSSEYLETNPISCRAICKSESSTQGMPPSETFKSQTGFAVYSAVSNENIQTNKQFLGKCSRLSMSCLNARYYNVSTYLPYLSLSKIHAIIILQKPSKIVL